MSDCDTVRYDVPIGDPKTFRFIGWHDAIRPFEMALSTRYPFYIV
jgi:hypothetical protein